MILSLLNVNWNYLTFVLFQLHVKAAGPSSKMCKSRRYVLLMMASSTLSIGFYIVALATPSWYFCFTHFIKFCKQVAVRKTQPSRWKYSFNLITSFWQVWIFLTRVCFFQEYLRAVLKILCCPNILYRIFQFKSLISISYWLW